MKKKPTKGQLKQEAWDKMEASGVFNRIETPDRILTMYNDGMVTIQDKTRRMKEQDAKEKKLIDISENSCPNFVSIY